MPWLHFNFNKGEGFGEVTNDEDEIVGYVTRMTRIREINEGERIEMDMQLTNHKALADDSP